MKYVTFIAPSTGDYYIYVRNKDGQEESTNYKLAVTKTSLNGDTTNEQVTESLSNDFINHNGSIIPADLTTFVNGELDNQLDIDWYRIPASNKDQIKTVILDGAEELKQNSVFVLYDPSEQQVVARAENSSSITYAMSAGRDYFVGITPKDTSEAWDAVKNQTYKLILTKELNFTPQLGGSYIYSNNKEAISVSQLADDNNQDGPKLLFSQSGLKTGTYTLMLTHRNETGLPIYVDVQFYAPYPTDNSKIQITKYGDDVAGEGYGDKSWSGMPGYAGYFGSTIGRVRKQLGDTESGQIDLFIPSYGLSKLKDTDNNFKDNPSIWLSTQYNNDAIDTRYPILTNGQLLYTMMEFEVVSDTGITVNIAAFEAEGAFEHRFDNYKATDYAPYEVEHTIKGISTFKPEVTASLDFYIDQNTDLNQRQEVVIKNPFYPNGIITNWWKTNMNPQFEEWNAHLNTESDLLAFCYQDDVRNWSFDTTHSYKDGSDLPSPTLVEPDKKSSTHDLACNLGNYGVRTTYKLHVANTTAQERIFCYHLETSSNLFLSVRDEDGSYMQFEVDGRRVNAICTGSVRHKGDLYPTDTGAVTVSLPESTGLEDNITELQIRIPANKDKTFYIDQVLTTGDPGSIPTSIIIR